MTTPTKTQSGLPEGAQGEDDEKPQPTYFIDPELAEATKRSLSLLVASKRCYLCQQADEQEVPPSPDAQPYIDRIVEHCSLTADYLLADTPLKEAIFKVILAGGNEPKTAEEISQVLSEKWAMAPYPRQLEPWVIQRLLDNSQSYCISRVPEPEPEEPPEEAVVAVEETPAESEGEAAAESSEETEADGGGPDDASEATPAEGSEEDEQA